MVAWGNFTVMHVLAPFQIDTLKMVCLFVPDGTVRCRGRTCQTPAAQNGDDDNNDVLIFSLVGVGLFIVLVTVIAVTVCVMRREEPSSFKKLPFHEEDGFGMVKQWQADYKLQTIER